MLSNVRIVLVETTHPGNIGAAARAMKNMGLSRLVLVNPRQFPHADATARASGADDVLATATVCATLDEALSDCGLVIGASARSRRLDAPQLDPRQSAQRILEETQATQAAVLFGREHAGLTNEELSRCHYHMSIPSNPDYSSLNVAAAVQVLAYELRMASGEGREAAAGGEPREAPAPAEQMERFYAHLKETLVEIGFLDPDNPRIMMRRLRRLFNRARPDAVELNILRGILTAAQTHRPKG
jgi:tRNA (cytidine32/uridine32-2'-O)-methyltransferase